MLKRDLLTLAARLVAVASNRRLFFPRWRRGEQTPLTPLIVELLVVSRTKDDAGIPPNRLRVFFDSFSPSQQYYSKLIFLENVFF